VVGGDDWFTCLLVSRVFFFYRHSSKALQHARTATEMNPGSHFAWHVQGNCERALAMYGRAERSYRRAMELDPEYKDSANAYSRLRRMGFWRRLLRRE
jgi:cytochrome c-type biogenesis protein CcmH/NrfG